MHVCNKSNHGTNRLLATQLRVPVWLPHIQRGMCEIQYDNTASSSLSHFVRSLFSILHNNSRQEQGTYGGAARGWTLHRGGHQFVL